MLTHDVATLLGSELDNTPTVHLVELTIEFLFSAPNQYARGNFCYINDKTTHAEIAMEEGGFSCYSGQNNDHAKQGVSLDTPEGCDVQIKPVSSVKGVATLFVELGPGVQACLNIKFLRSVPRRKRYKLQTTAVTRSGNV